LRRARLGAETGSGQRLHGRRQNSPIGQSRSLQSSSSLTSRCWYLESLIQRRITCMCQQSPPSCDDGSTFPSPHFSFRGFFCPTFYGGPFMPFAITVSHSISPYRVSSERDHDISLVHL